MNRASLAFIICESTHLSTKKCGPEIDSDPHLTPEREQEILHCIEKLGNEYLSIAGEPVFPKMAVSPAALTSRTHRMPFPCQRGQGNGRQEEISIYIVYNKIFLY